MIRVTKLNRFKLDQVYLRILEVLQRQGRISNHNLAEAVSLSASPVLERVRKLESSGIVRAYGADIDLAKICSCVMVWAELKLDCFAKNFRAFDHAVNEIPEIVECYRVTGASHYLMRFVCTDTAAYFALTDRMVALEIGIAEIQTRIVIERTKQFNGYPLQTLAGEAPSAQIDSVIPRADRNLAIVRQNGRRVG
jgi:DNA-binding Lrp family transcriptional regulator